MLAHYRLAGTCGTGCKPDDTQAAIACNGCHDVIDGRTKTTDFTYDELRLMHAEGVMRTPKSGGKRDSSNHENLRYHAHRQTQMTRADKWKQRPEVIRYRAFCDEARLRKIHLPDSGAHVTFVMPMPQSWSHKKRAQYAGRPHQSKPDCDNMLKALMDALYEDDSHVWDCRITKIWGEKGQIIIGESL